MDSIESNDSNEQELLCGLLIVYVIGIVMFDISLHYIKMALFQQQITLLISGFIQLYAGYLLFDPKHNVAISKIGGLLAMIPPLMDLKGNLEITMASRISTVANTTDNMKTIHGMGKMVGKNAVLVQCQVTIVGLFAVILAATFSHFQHSPITMDRLAMLSAISLLTSTITCTMLGSVMTVGICLLSQSGYDPDDVATSIAASTGDLITIFLIGQFAIYLPTLGSTFCWTISIVILLFFPPLFFLLLKDPWNRSKIKSSLISIMIATIISLFAGFTFEHVNQIYPQISLIGPVFTGFTGNSISIVTSLLSTVFDRIDLIPIKNRPKVNWLLNCRQVFQHYEQSPKISMTCRSHLLHVVIPCQFAFLLALRTFAGSEYLVLSPIFMSMYLLASFVLLPLMIYLTCNMVHVSWNLKLDPDEAVIPITTSICDFTGTILLFGVFTIMNRFHDPNTAKTNL
ncbi:hypothetical protein RDWZM_002358 [Blomia tropicalis]|uniref:SLC41A/MgtE integral membrane domain-containing protein n=1 Tax=Blomia tropicalis TaxID=40697 RepID=A0A9Q0MEZ2_BLOTA|nr:hypothetical protein RDWZM_002358 [Blomia tropicalis]